MIPQKTAENFDKLFAMAFNMLCTHQYAEAYSMLLLAEKSCDNPAVSFNLALCCMQADEMNVAMNYIEKAMMQIRKITSATIINNKLYDTLLSLQCNTNDYCKPMDSEYPLRFAKNAEQRILRLSVDIYCKMELWNKVQQTVSIIKSKNYKNVNEALEKAK